MLGTVKNFILTEKNKPMFYRYDIMQAEKLVKMYKL